VSAVIVALAGIDGSLVADELIGAGGKGFAGSDDAVRAPVGQDLIADLIPNFDLGASQAAEAPLVIDEGVDEGALGGIGRKILLVIFGAERGEAFSGLVAYDLSLVVWTPVLTADGPVLFGALRRLAGSCLIVAIRSLV